MTANFEMTAAETAARLLPPTTPPRRTMIPRTAPIIQLLSIGTDIAVENATQDSHDTDAERFHARYKVAVPCPRCAPPESISAQVDAIKVLDELAPWQQEMVDEIAAAQNEAPASPALQEYLEERGLVPDRPEVTVEDVDAVKAATRDDYGRHELVDFEVLTTKQLRPLASAAGMKGARVAKKSEMVAFLAAQS